MRGVIKTGYIITIIIIIIINTFSSQISIIRVTSPFLFSSRRPCDPCGPSCFLLSMFQLELKVWPRISLYLDQPTTSRVAPSILVNARTTKAVETAFLYLWKFYNICNTVFIKSTRVIFNKTWLTEACRTFPCSWIFLLMLKRYTLVVGSSSVERKWRKRRQGEKRWSVNESRGFTESNFCE